MAPASIIPVRPPCLRRELLAAEVSVVLWTGRSAMSAATETALSRFFTSGAHRTRVSAMRAPTTRGGSGARQRLASGPGDITQRRRVSEVPLIRG